MLGVMEDLSSICIPCGHRCNGTLHAQVRVTEEEVSQILERTGIQADDHLLRLPCPVHSGVCTIYSNRPQACRTYQCNLLNLVRDGTLGVQRALELVAMLHAKVAEYKVEYNNLSTYSEQHTLRQTIRHSSHPPKYQQEYVEISWSDM